MRIDNVIFDLMGWIAFIGCILVSVAVLVIFGSVISLPIIGILLPFLLLVFLVIKQRGNYQIDESIQTDETTERLPDRDFNIQVLRTEKPMTYHNHDKYTAALESWKARRESFNYREPTRVQNIRDFWELFRFLFLFFICLVWWIGSWHISVHYGTPIGCIAFIIGLFIFLLIVGMSKEFIVHQNHRGPRTFDEPEPVLVAAVQPQERTTELEKATQSNTNVASQTRFDSQVCLPNGQSNIPKASWDTLIISQSLRENLKAYCRILRNYEAYRAQGVHLPKGLLFHGPPGCGKTQIAKTLSAEAGLNFVALTTSDCKAMWIGHSADRLATVFRKARAKQPSLIFIDELDAVCPPRGMYHDCIAQEFTAQLLQEIDGLFSDSQAIFLVGATNRPDHVDAAILSRFAERIAIPLPDAATRVALLTLFLASLKFSGDKISTIERLALYSVDESGRDLRARVTKAVLNAVKRTNSPQDFALSEADFKQT